MNYINPNTLVVEELQAIREANPQMSIPDGADLSDIGYAKFLTTLAPNVSDRMRQGVRETAPAPVGGAFEQRWEIYSLSDEEIALNLRTAQATAWEQIKAERDRRASLGVKVGAHWYHGDQKSRTQQLGLVLLGASIPAGLQWKTLTFTPPPVFVTMTPALAQAIVGSTAASDTAIFTAAEVHRLAMEASAAPQDYDFSVGWPTSIEEEANAEGIQFDASLL